MVEKKECPRKIIKAKSGKDFIKKAVEGHVSVVRVTPDEVIEVKKTKKSGSKGDIIKTNIFFTLIEASTIKGDVIKFKQFNGKSRIYDGVLGEKKIKSGGEMSEDGNLSRTIGYGNILKEELYSAVIEMQGQAKIGADEYQGRVEEARKSGIIFPSVARFNGSD